MRDVRARFKSVLVDGAGHALATMAAYIDLNPIRGGMVKDPKEYRWSGYGEAVAGRKPARLGLQRLASVLTQKEETVTKSLATYRLHLYNEGHEQREVVGEDGQTVRGALRHEEVLSVLKKKGTLKLGDYLRCRVRYFCDGTVFGSREFVDEIFHTHRRRFGRRRRTGARRLKGVDDPLFALRDLRVNVFG